MDKSIDELAEELELLYKATEAAGFMGVRPWDVVAIHVQSLLIRERIDEAKLFNGHDRVAMLEAKLKEIEQGI